MSKIASKYWNFARSMTYCLVGQLRTSPVLIQSPRYPRVRREEGFLGRFQAEIDLPRPWQAAVVLGFGSLTANPFRAETAFGIDVRKSNSANILVADLAQESIPLPEEAVEIVTAMDFLEHIPRALSGHDRSTRFPLVELFSEIHRILKPGGIFYSRSPCFPYSEAFQDPTHVNIMIEDTIPFYFCKSSAQSAEARLYGFKGSFKLVAQAWCGAHLLSLLRKCP
jgi:SAM-dependent methyltransferase